ncbi:recombinase family protein [Clostridium sp.]|uniref:recombinase family protein n=1 Tax=Clostridium sp. TaxID=1506 RepID=UPI002FCA33BD
MKAAIYSRKSKFTGKGDSVENQIQICKEYAKLHFDNITNDSFEIYEDEGFSGGNTNRPMFQQFLEDIKLKKFDILMCYRLDRISRNVADFSATLETLQKYNVEFVSIKEQFDTSTPMGRAMVYISSVFAQLERETIAERVRDNMLELAKTGRWLGGQTPLGFNSEQITYLDAEFKERSMYKLAPDTEELEIVKLIYSKYLEFQSLRKVHTYLLKNNIKTKQGKDWLASSLSNVLTSPVYVKATSEVFTYLESRGINTVGTPNNINGILTYNKKKGRSQHRDEEEWIASIAKHEGVIDGDTWLKVQYMLEENKSKAPRLGKTHNVLLTGILRCEKCGSNMGVVHGRKDSNGNKIYYYACTMKQDSRGTRCNNENVRADELEEMVISKLKLLYSNRGELVKELNGRKKLISINKDKETLIANTKNSIVEIETSINNLIEQLATTSPAVSKYIIADVERRTEQLEKLKINLLELQKETIEQEEELVNINLLIQGLKDISMYIDTADQDTKKKLLSICLDQVTWNSETGIVDFNLWNEGSKKK